MTRFRWLWLLVTALIIAAATGNGAVAANPAQTSSPTATVIDTATYTVTPTSSPAITATAIATVTPSDTATAMPSDTATATASSVPVASITDSPTSTPTVLADNPTATRTATPAPPSVEPGASIVAFFTRAARTRTHAIRLGRVTLFMTVGVAQRLTSPVQLGWSISTGASIVAHHQIHTDGWTGTRTFAWTYVFTRPGSYVAIGVLRAGGKTQVRANALDVRAR